MFDFLVLRLDMLIYLYSSTLSTQAAVFQECRMAQEWIDTARDIVEAEFMQGYASRDVEEDETPDPDVRMLTLNYFAWPQPFFIRKRLQHQAAIHLTIYRLYQLLINQTFEMSLRGFLPPILKRSLMYFCGGLNESTFILACTTWLLIICQFHVSDHIGLP